MSLIGNIPVVFTVFFYLLYQNRTVLYIFTDSCVQDIYSRKLGPYGTVGHLKSYIKLILCNVTHFCGCHIEHVMFVDNESHLPYGMVMMARKMKMKILTRYSLVWFVE